MASLGNQGMVPLDKIRMIKRKVAQASRLCSLLKLPEELCPIGKNLEVFILLPGAVKKGEVLSPEERTIALEALALLGWSQMDPVCRRDHA